MANGRNKGRGDSGRDSGGFIAIPWSVLDCAAYARLSHPARSLLLELARQLGHDNNGRLLASATYLSKRGWNSSDVITRAKRELLEAKFIHETVKGHRPNKASWYAATWRALEKLPGYDFGAEATFERSAYKLAEPLKVKPTRDELYDRWNGAAKNASLTPSGGVATLSIAPPGGVGASRVAPSGGPIRPPLRVLSTPSHGNHLDMPSAAAN